MHQASLATLSLMRCVIYKRDAPHLNKVEQFPLLQQTCRYVWCFIMVKRPGAHIKQSKTGRSTDSYKGKRVVLPARYFLFIVSCRGPSDLRRTLKQHSMCPVQEMYDFQAWIFLPKAQYFEMKCVALLATYWSRLVPISWQRKLGLG